MYKFYCMVIVSSCKNVNDICIKVQLYLHTYKYINTPLAMCVFVHKAVIAILISKLYKKSQ